MHNRIIDLSQNEGCISPPIETLFLSRKNSFYTTRYPHIDNVNQLKEAIAERNSLSPCQVTIGCGSTELINCVIYIAGRGDGEVIIPQYAFSLYKKIAESFAIKYIEVENNTNKQNLAKIIALVTNKTKLIILTNPSNPLGTFIPFKELRNFISQIPAFVTIMIDEAYYEYMDTILYHSAISLIKEYSNVIVMRTFSKAYGLAGLRIGYCLSNSKNISLLNSIINPYNVNAFAIEAAYHVYHDRSFVNNVTDTTKVGISQLKNGLSKLGIECVCYTANFITFKTKIDCRSFCENVSKHGILIRSLHDYGLRNYVRITVGTPYENEALLNVFAILFQYHSLEVL